MKLIANKNESPPGSWRYTEPTTGVSFKTYAWDQMIDMVRKHKNGNQIEMPPDWYEQLENEVCEQNEMIPCYDPEKVGTGCNLSLTVIKRFLSTVWTWVKSGASLVDDKEAVRRAEICKGCPFNVVVAGCYSCKGIRGIVNELKGDKTVPQESYLQSCAKCCCENKTSVWIPLEAINYPDVEFPSWCWKAPQAKDEATVPPQGDLSI